MTVHVQVHHKSGRVLVEIDRELDAKSVEHCLAAYDRGQISGWKEITLVLRELDRVDAAGVELLLYLQERARQCRLRVFDCDEGVLSVLEAAGLKPQRGAAAPASAAARPALAPAPKQAA
ncbi:MAG TPA: STAS domain-containing protein [Pelomicrobium sp.]|nr:STAS domain-containing protein [Pelomicrobium sp.]